MSPNTHIRRALLCGLICIPTLPAPADTGPRGDDLLVVDCLLPGQLRRLGTRLTFVTSRRATKIPAAECEIRGGEYTAYDRASLATSLRIWLPRAEDGDAEAQTYVGEMFEKGLGVPADHAAAAGWYQRAADQGFARAQINLGSLYEKGLGVPRDPLKALEWYRKASGLNEPVFEVTPVPDPSTEVARLREQVRELRRQLEQKETLLERTQQEIEALRRELGKRSSAVQAEREKLARLQAQLASDDEQSALQESASEEERRALELRVAESERRLAARNEELAALQSSLSALERESERHRQEVERLRAERSGTGPIIEILTPEVFAMRGTRGLRIEPGLSELLLVGRVDAPDGLLTLTVNGQEQELEPNDLFRARVRLSGQAERIRVVAIDRAGRKTIEDFSRSPFSAPLPSVASPAPEAIGLPIANVKFDFGRYHALVIGNDQYQSLPDLETAVADAKAVAKILKDQYGFEVTLLTDATRYAILSALNSLRKGLTSEDNLLIYYAGHGDLDRANQRGHWLPVDAERDSSANWISNISVTDILNTMTVRQMLVVADSCYSGALTRSAVAQLEAGRTPEERLELVRALLGRKARMVLTSGGLEPVLDSVGGEHSDFAASFLSALGRNQGILSGRELHQAILPKVATTAGRMDFHQVPEYAPIKFAGHEAGDFFFVRAYN